MKKYFYGISLFAVFLFSGFFTITGNVSAASSNIEEVENKANEGTGVGIFAEIGPTYPGTNINMQVGDLLYSSKTLGGSTEIVGHIGIVGSDFRIYHVTPGASGGAADSVTTYMGRHRPGEKIEIYQKRNGGGVTAATWAKNNYSRAKAYGISYGKLSVMTPNYCSKFIWQAFYYGSNFDSTVRGRTDADSAIIAPSIFTNAQQFVLRGSFVAK
ncbi:hypothetical protein Q0F98_03225 [Paenibacillus amylolyticus]|nr:hypothetical protein Q0F98_03225 [Paenibacillus amylolyticus]